MDYTAIQTTATIVGILSGAIGVGAFLVTIWRSITSLTAKLDLFWEDWNGSEARAGRDATPGVMDRLNKIDGELKHNGGSTMKDAVKRIESKVDTISERIEKGDQRFIEGNSRFADLEQKLTNLLSRLDEVEKRVN